MPNWCLNGLEITGPEEDVHAFSIKATGEEHSYSTDAPAGSSLLSFHRLAPLPEAVLQRRRRPGNAPARLAGALPSILNSSPPPVAAVASLDGWLAEKAMWGAAGGAYHPEVFARGNGRITYTFETAWEPPVLLLLRVSRDFPTLTFSLAFSEFNSDLRAFLAVHGGCITLRELPPIGSYPREDDYDDFVLLCKDQDAYCEVYDRHIWDLVRVSREASRP